MKTIFLFGALLDATSRASGVGGGSGTTLSGIMSSLKSGFGTLTKKVLQTGTGSARSEEQTTLDIALAYIGGPVDGSLGGIQVENSFQGTEWGKCRKENVPLGVDWIVTEADLTAFLAVLQGPEPIAEHTLRGHLEIRANELGRDLTVDWEHAMDHGDSALDFALRACESGLLNAWAQHMDGTCRDFQKAGGAAGDERGAALLACLTRKGANLSREGRKWLIVGEQIRKDMTRLGFDDFVAPMHGEDPDVFAVFKANLPARCHRIALTWTMTVVPWYDFSQTAVDVCMHFLGVQRQSELEALQGITVFRDRITRISRYPEELQRAYEQVLVSFWAQALKKFFSDPFVEAFAGASIHFFQLEMFLLRPSVHPAAIEFLFAFGRPALFAFYIASVNTCFNSYRAYMNNYRIFKGSPADWSTNFYANIAEILEVGHGIPAGARVRDISKYSAANAMEFDIYNSLLGKPIDYFCFGDWQIPDILDNAYKILNLQIRNSVIPAAKTAPKSKGLKSRFGKTVIKPGDEDGEEEDALEDDSDRGIRWPESISFPKLVELIDLLVDRKMMLVQQEWMQKKQQEAAPMTGVVSGGLNLGLLPEKLDVDLVDPESSLALSERCTTARIPSFRLTTSREAIASIDRFIERDPEVGDLADDGRQIVVDGVLRFREPDSYEVMLAQLIRELESCRAGNLGPRDRRPVTQACLRSLSWIVPRHPFLDAFVECMTEDNTRDSLVRNHAWALGQINKHEIHAETECAEILAVYAVVFMNSADAIMDGEPVAWCIALRQSTHAYTKEQTLAALSVLSNQVVGLTRFGPNRSRQYLYTLASYWLMALRSYTPSLREMKDVERAVHAIRSFGGCLERGGLEFVLSPHKKNGLFALFAARFIIEPISGSDDCPRLLELAQTFLTPGEGIPDNSGAARFIPIPNLVNALDKLVDGAMNLNGF
jgi:hypothetical protein